MVGKPLVGIIGGVGPAATARLSMTIVDRTLASCDQDHVRTLVANDTTLPDRSAFILGRSGRSPLPGLIADARFLEESGCCAIALPCNTAHHFWSEVQASVEIPLINMVRETALACKTAGMRNVGVLATEGTIAVGVYDEALKEAGLSPVHPDADVQKAVTSLIYDGVKAGKQVTSAHLNPLVEAMKQRGCDGVILGCTELSEAAANAEYGAPAPQDILPVVDSIIVLANRVIDAAGATRRYTTTYYTAAEPYKA